jgi:hypothetical protein
MAYGADMPQTPSQILAVTSSLTATARALIGGSSMADLQPGNQLDTLLDAVSGLDAAGVQSALIGGLAVGIRAAVPRATMDVDLVAVSGVERSAVVAALTAAGFTHQGSFAHSENFLHTTGEPVQVAFDPAMDGAILRAEVIAVGDRTIRVVQTDDLIAMKERAGQDPSRRPSKALRDLADVALLREDGAELEDGW